MAMKKQFTKTQWNNDRDPAITAEQLNRMEKGIDDNDTRIVELDKAVTANKTAGDESLAEVNETLQKHTEDITAVNTELTSQSKALGELSDKKITKFYASSQGENTLNDSDDGKMQDMMLYGKSEQKQYSGKNLLNYNVTVAGRTVQNDETIKSNVTSDDRLWTYQEAEYKLSLGAGTYIISINVLVASGSENGRAKVFLSDGTQLGYIDEAFKSNKVGTYIKKIILGSDSSIGIMCKTYKASFTIQIEKGSESTTFEPYVGGIPSPNPDYPQEIKSVVEPVVKVTGKNLLNATLQTVTQNGVTCTNNGDGTYTLNGTATADVILILATNVARYFGTNNSLKLIGLTKTGSPTTFDFRCYIESTGTFLDYGSGTIIPKPKNNNSNIAVVVKKGTKLDNLVLKPMLVADLNATIDDFEPYHEQSVTLTGITLNAIPVSSGGNVTIDGQQYISDYVDVERGKIVRMVLPIGYNGSEDWYLQSINQHMIANFSLHVTPEVRANIGLSNRLILQETLIADTTGEGFFVSNESNCYIRLNKNRASTASEFKSFLSNNHIHIMFVRSTPTEESLSEELAEKLKALQTYYPQTNLFITSNQLDGYAIFNYPISLANGWNYVKQQIGDTRDYIYDMDLQMAQAYVNSEYAVALTELEV